MVSTKLDFTLDSPTEGTRFANGVGISVSGFAHVTNVGLPTFVINGVDVQFGVGGPIVNAPLSGSNWSCIGVPQVTNTVLELLARCHITFLDGSGTSISTVAGHVVMGALIPRVDIDPFTTDVTVTEVPYILPSVSGSVTEPFTTFSNVTWRIGTGAPTPVDSVSGNRWVATNLPFPAGRRTLTIQATDPFNSSGSASVDVSVRVPIDPSEKDRVFAVTSYLGELLGLAQRYVSVDGAPPGPSRADLEARLHQPLDGLTKAAAFAAATADVSQTRLAVEVLRGVIAPDTTQDIDRTYRQLAYQALIEAQGASLTELRLSRTAPDADRRVLAARLGLDPTQLGDLDRITLTAEKVTDATLAQVFGYQPPVAPSLAAPPPGSPDFQLAQRAALRRTWRDADGQLRDEPANPLIMPELVSDADFVSTDPATPARQLWSARVAWRAAQQALIATAVAGTHRTPAGFDAAVASFIGAVDLAALAARDQAGEDIGPDLLAVGLDKPTLRRLAQLRALLGSGGSGSGGFDLGDEEWAEIVGLLLTVNERHQFQSWRAEEVERSIVLDPSVFAVPSDTSPVTPQWRHTLAARTTQLSSLDSAFAKAVADTERRVLAQLRDALITEIGARQAVPESLETAADRLSRILSVDLRTRYDRRTSRVGQAVESLQAMLTTARSGGYRPELGVPVLQIANENPFDLEWDWLLSYDRWIAAMRAFAYPENQLQPQLFVAENAGTGLVLAPTATYTAFIKALSALARPTPDQVRALVKNQYLLQLPANQQPVGLNPSEQLTNADLLARQTLCKNSIISAVPGITLEAQVPQHLREIFLLVPLAAAGKLQAAGQFVAALDWYQSVFAFQLPGPSRPIYYGLVLEQALTSDYGRLPDWLAQVQELNPHFTARKRRGAYTRATALSVVQCFLAYADSEFAQHDRDARARALTLYQDAQDLLLLLEIKPETGPLVPFPDNPVWQSLSSLATAALAKMHAGLDIAGQPDPSLADGGNALPSPYRFSVLVDRAKTLVGIAQQVETAYLSALERLDGENYALLQAGYDLRTANGSLVAQDLRVDVAATGIEQAGIQRDRAEVQLDTYDQWLSDGLNGAEQAGLDLLRVTEVLHVAAGIAQAVSADTFWKGAGPVLAEAAAAASTEAQIQQTTASYERRAQEWQLNRAVAATDVRLAQSQITSAQLQHQVAVQEREVAADQLAHAQAVAEFLATKFTNAELYDWMSGVLGGVYAFFLQQATALALLAQAQLAFERQEAVSGFIAADYWQPAAEQGNTSQSTPDRRGITGSVRLLSDIVRLDEHAFDTDQRKLQLTHTVAVSQVAAYEFARFRETGVLTFATSQELFDRQFPGHYLRLIKRVSVSVIALLPALQGLRATLSASGVSRAVVLRDSFETVALRRQPESIAFTSPLNATGLFQLDADSTLMLPFEGMGVDAVWQLELPKPANPFDFRTIADVLFTIEYTALDSSDYRQKVIRSLDNTFSADRSFSIRDEFPDSWYELNNPDTVQDPTPRMRAVLPLTSDDLPPHITDLTVAQLTIFVVRDDALDTELTISALRHTVGGQTIEAKEVRTIGGISGTRRPDGAAWQAFVGTDPTGTWEIQLEDTDTVRSWFTENLIQDLVLVFTLAGTVPAWT